MNADRSEPSSTDARRIRWICALLAGAILLAYTPALSGPFVFDDIASIVANPTLRDATSLAIFQPPGRGVTVTGRPLLNASFAFNHAFGGLAPNGRYSPSSSVPYIALRW